jgi:enoyl-CoA hydratase/carnithine racemase
MADEELIVRCNGVLGVMTLNRPAAIGALTPGMCEAMIAALRPFISMRN